MSNREFQDSPRTQYLKGAYQILKDQGGVHGGWWHGDKHHGLLCLEGALQKTMDIGLIVISKKDKLDNSEAYKFLMQEAKALVVEGWYHPPAGWKWIPKVFWPAEKQMSYFRSQSISSPHFTALHLFNDFLGQDFVYSLMERAIAKSEALDRKESTLSVLELVA